ncbi:MAG: (S)-ureidoglycine aminohydrolase [Stappiaceae bacterium]
MRQKFGETRSSIKDKHALMSADSFEQTTLPNWKETAIVVVISPHVGAAFSQYFATLTPASVGGAPYVEGIERFFFVLDGAVSLSVAEQEHTLEAEGYAYLPAGTSHQITTRSDSARIVVLERRYGGLPHQGEVPPMVVGSTLEITSGPLKGDESLQLKKLMPEDERYDFEVNTMDFEPGASLSYVETHFMEHGLLMLNGGGVYRLDDSWYSVQEGDIIWMGPFCAQWFGAIGKSNARYLIYKNWNRDPLDPTSML